MPQAQAPEQPPKITKLSLIAATWSLFAISVVFFSLRVAVRLTVARRLHTDDAWSGLALAILLGLAITLTVAIPDMYQLLNVGAGLEKPGADFLSNASEYLKLQFALTILYWSCIWAVKACFLSFFHRLTVGLKWCRWAWWATVVITTISYIGCVITYPVSCASFTLGDCESQIHVSRSLISLRYSTAVDILTDAMIMALPLYLAMRVQLPWTQKLALGGIFSLGIIVILFAIIRIVVTNQHDSHPEVSWLNLWSQIEASVAVIISSLAPFKALFTHRRKSSYQNDQSPHGIPNLRSRKSASGHAASIPLDERSHTYAENGTIGFAGKASGDSTERILRGYHSPSKDPF
ncbi:hypothetical protein MMC21_001279 [Puttea exsequens]|nr:hypothetical protein [Puttea exsequens]